MYMFVVGCKIVESRWENECLMYYKHRWQNDYSDKHEGPLIIWVYSLGTVIEQQVSTCLASHLASVPFERPLTRNN